MGGIIIISTPLFVLFADQIVKFTIGDERYGTIKLHHMDEVYDKPVTKYISLLARMVGLPVNTTSTVFLFSSPQFSVHHPDFYAAAKKPYMVVSCG